MKLWDFCNRRRTEVEAREAIIDFLQRNKHRPSLIGELALHIGPLWSLLDTENLTLRMVSEGLVREATPEEAARFMHDGFYLV